MPRYADTQKIAILRCAQGCKTPTITINDTSVAGSCGGPYVTIREFRAVKTSDILRALKKTRARPKEQC